MIFYLRKAKKQQMQQTWFVPFIKTLSYLIFMFVSDSLGFRIENYDLENRKNMP